MQQKIPYNTANATLYLLMFLLTAKLENCQQTPIASLCSCDGRNKSELKNALKGLSGADPSVAMKYGTMDTTAATKVSKSD